MSVVETAVSSHRALLHDGPHDLSRRVVPELSVALTRGEPVHVSLTTDEWAVLRRELGELAGGVTFLPAHRRYANPGRAMAALHDFVAGALDQGASTVWSIGSVQVSGDPDVDVRWARYESAVDVVLAGAPLHGICAFDRTRSPIEIVDTLRRCHTMVDEPGFGSGPCADHRSYLHTSAPWSHRAAPPELELWDTDPGSVRVALSHLCAGSVGRERLADLHLIATELVTNGLRHGAPPVGLRVWRLEGSVVLEAWDHGPGIADPYADLRPRHGGVDGGFGMWLVGQLTDQVSIGQEDGRTVVVARLHTNA